MGLLSPTYYDSLLIEKVKNLLNKAMIKDQSRLKLFGHRGNKNNRGDFTYEEFVNNLDTENRSSMKAIEYLLAETIARIPSIKSKSIRTSIIPGSALTSNSTSIGVQTPIYLDVEEEEDAAELLSDSESDTTLESRAANGYLVRTNPFARTGTGRSENRLVANSDGDLSTSQSGEDDEEVNIDFLTSTRIVNETEANWILAEREVEREAERLNHEASFQEDFINNGPTGGSGSGGRSTVVRRVLPRVLVHGRIPAARGPTSSTTRALLRNRNNNVINLDASESDLEMDNQSEEEDDELVSPVFSPQRMAEEVLLSAQIEFERVTTANRNSGRNRSPPLRLPPTPPPRRERGEGSRNFDYAAGGLMQFSGNGSGIRVGISPLVVLPGGPSTSAEAAPVETPLIPAACPTPSTSTSTTALNPDPVPIPPIELSSAELAERLISRRFSQPPW